MLGSLFLIAAITLWGWSFVATKICLEVLTPAQIITARFLLALPVLITIARIRGLSFAFVRRSWPLMIGSALVLVLHLVIQVEGMKTTTATNTAWLITTIPVFIVVLSYLFLGEKVNWRQISGMAVAAAGVVILVSRGRLGSLQFLRSWGDWLVLASCVTWAVYTIAGKKMTRENPLAVTTINLVIAAAVIVPPTLYLTGWHVYLDLPARQVLALLFLGPLCLGVAYWFWFEGLSRKPAGQAGAFIYLEPFATMLAAPFFLGEAITAAVLSGGALVILGVWLAQNSSKKEGGRRQGGG